MDTAETLAGRLKDALAELPERPSDAAATPPLTELAVLADQLHDRLMAMPAELRRLVHTADAGFASSGQWVAEAIAKQDAQIGKLARATGMVAAWHGPGGGEIERRFVIRGHIRGWAHRWRQEDRGPAQVDSDPDFVAFAGDCLARAGIEGAPKQLIGKALGKDWRTA